MSGPVETQKLSVEVPRPPLQTDIIIGRNLLGKSAEVMDLSPYTQFVVVSDRELVKSFGTKLVESLNQTGKPTHLFTTDVLESNKTEEEADRILGEVLAITPVVDRKALIFALGGGMVGDLTGYVASRVLRGVDFVQVPTTLLAMVDSSLGGKTAVDYNNLTNMIGAFHLPRATIMDIDTLRTLPDRQVTSGFAELVKHGFLDVATSELLASTDAASLKNSDDQLIKVLGLSARYKMSIVRQDFEEKTGVRQILNFGHTIGRAIETATDLTRFTHGEAVALGTTAALLISNRMGLLPEGDVKEMLHVVKRFGLLTEASRIDRNLLWVAISADKKAINGVPRFVLLEGIGRPKKGCVVERQVVDEVLDKVCPT